MWFYTVGPGLHGLHSDSEVFMGYKNIYIFYNIPFICTFLSLALKYNLTAGLTEHMDCESGGTCF